MCVCVCLVSLVLALVRPNQQRKPVRRQEPVCVCVCVRVCLRLCGVIVCVADQARHRLPTTGKRSALPDDGGAIVWTREAGSDAGLDSDDADKTDKTDGTAGPRHACETGIRYCADVGNASGDTARSYQLQVFDCVSCLYLFTVLHGITAQTMGRGRRRHRHRRHRTDTWPVQTHATPATKHIH